MDNGEIDGLVRKAQGGDKASLQELVGVIQDDVYRLALRMLYDPDDAGDAAQEILILVVTKLSTFEFRSAFRTWMYRVAANYLIGAKKNRDKDPKLSFDDYRQDLGSDLAESGDHAGDAEHQVLLNEVRISCTMAMLLCLDAKHRLAYILGDIMELDHAEAGAALAISQANFRKQLSRARTKVVDFTSKSCGLVSDDAKCSCAKKLPGAARPRRWRRYSLCGSVRGKLWRRSGAHSGLARRIAHPRITNIDAPVQKPR
jgi:RNA polymerase sigma factor (sigma-70 family)